MGWGELGREGGSSPVAVQLTARGVVGSFCCTSSPPLVGTTYEADIPRLDLATGEYG